MCYTAAVVTSVEASTWLARVRLLSYHTIVFLAWWQKDEDKIFNRSHMYTYVCYMCWRTKWLYQEGSRVSPLLYNWCGGLKARYLLFHSYSCFPSSQPVVVASHIKDLAFDIMRKDFKPRFECNAIGLSAVQMWYGAWWKLVRSCWVERDRGKDTFRS